MERRSDGATEWCSGGVPVSERVRECNQAARVLHYDVLYNAGVACTIMQYRACGPCCAAVCCDLNPPVPAESVGQGRRRRSAGGVVSDMIVDAVNGVM